MKDLNAALVVFTLTASLTVPGSDQPCVTQRKAFVQVSVGTITYSAYPRVVGANGIVKLSWNITGASAQKLTPGDIPLPPTGTRYVVIPRTQTVTFVATEMGTGRQLVEPIVFTVDPTIVPTEVPIVKSGPNGGPGAPGEQGFRGGAGSHGGAAGRCPTSRSISVRSPRIRRRRAWSASKLHAARAGRAATGAHSVSSALAPAATAETAAPAAPERCGSTRLSRPSSSSSIFGPGRAARAAAVIPTEAPGQRGPRRPGLSSSTSRGPHHETHDRIVR